MIAERTVWIVAFGLIACGEDPGEKGTPGADMSGQPLQPPAGSTVQPNVTPPAAPSNDSTSPGAPGSSAPVSPVGSVPSAVQPSATGLPAPVAPSAGNPQPTTPQPSNTQPDSTQPSVAPSTPEPEDAESDGGATNPDPDEPAPTPGSGSCSGPALEADEQVFDCGDAHVFEDNGPPANRVNYVIVADGYTASELDTALVEHVENMLYNEETGMYSEVGEPYRRYRRFINVCAMRSVSNESGVDGPDGNPSRDTVFDGGNCGDRLGCVSQRLVRDYLTEQLPEHVDADWTAATMNANEWWNSGGSMMVWSGKFMETSPNQAASVALHEGGHSFHQLADEYADEALNCNCSAAREPNVACETEPGMSAEEKWGDWFGFMMEGGSRLWNLGEHGAVPGGRYCGASSGVTRPTEDSEMNLLPYAFNMPSIEKAVRDIYEIVRPIDTHTPNAQPVTGAADLQVRVVDPEVLTVEWTVDGEVVAADGDECFSTADLPSGEHTVTVRVYDDTPWVRGSREDLEQSVEWTVVVP